MTRRALSGWICLAAGVAGVGGSACREDLRGGAVLIPAGECRLGRAAVVLTEVGPFRLGRSEVTVADYCRYLSAENPDGADAHPQVRRVGDRFRPASGQSRRPAAWVSLEDAKGYCRWLGAELGLVVRLPTLAEWEYAARGGRDSVRYPWGWGSSRGKARVHSDGPGPVKAYPPSDWGLYDMAGNLAEWCLAPDGTGVACGGSWADQTPEAWAVYTHTALPAGYRDGDVGFRIVLDTPPADSSKTRSPGHG